MIHLLNVTGLTIEYEEKYPARIVNTREEVKHNIIGGMKEAIKETMYYIIMFPRGIPEKTLLRDLKNKSGVKCKTSLIKISGIAQEYLKGTGRLTHILLPSFIPWVYQHCEVREPEQLDYNEKIYYQSERKCSQFLFKLGIRVGFCDGAEHTRRARWYDHNDEILKGKVF